ncbi:MAG: hypothetical protein AB8F74_11490 [Saprospiraceae bacterium]
MLKLYKEIEGELHYWETWETAKGKGMIHKGIVGDRGKDKEVKADYRKVIDQEIERLVKEDYDEIPLEAQDTLVVEYQLDVKENQLEEDRWKRLEELVDHALGWTGLGHCEGRESEETKVEISCRVVDVEKAVALLKDGLDRSAFKHYARMYKKS